MYLLYIDDAGTCTLKKDKNYGPDGGESRFFVLGAILIKASELNKFEPNLNNIRIKCLKNELEEIKSSTSKLNCVKSCQKDLDKMCYRTTISKFISNIDCVLFAVAQDKYVTTTNGIVTNKNDIYKLAFQNLLKLVDTYMFDNKINENTISFIDKKNSSYEMDTIVYKAYKEALENKKVFKSFSNNLFSPTINVVYSQYTSGVQLADFVAGSIWRALENHDNIEKVKEAKKITNILKTKFYTKENMILGYGLANDWIK